MRLWSAVSPAHCRGKGITACIWREEARLWQRGAGCRRWSFGRWKSAGVSVSGFVWGVVRLRINVFFQGRVWTSPECFPLASRRDHFRGPLFPSRRLDAAARRAAAADKPGVPEQLAHRVPRDVRAAPPVRPGRRPAEARGRGAQQVGEPPGRRAARARGGRRRARRRHLRDPEPLVRLAPRVQPPGAPGAGGLAAAGAAAAGAPGQLRGAGQHALRGQVGPAGPARPQQARQLGHRVGRPARGGHPPDGDPGPAPGPQRGRGRVRQARGELRARRVQLVSAARRGCSRLVPAARKQLAGGWPHHPAARPTGGLGPTGRVAHPRRGCAPHAPAPVRSERLVRPERLA
mmetsp:Transcript_20541/g.42606  ORF Transcript_20541/g.42606 Transcript_20541/m.42606 type:complete len:347 (-) Transcript_20541:236-1276(-)